MTNKFAEHVRRMQMEDREGSYRAAQFCLDVKRIGADMDLFGAMPCGPGFSIVGRMDCDGEKTVVSATITPQLYLVSVSEALKTYEKVFDRFAELFDQKPDVVYHDRGNRLNTAEYWPDAGNGVKKKNIGEIEACPDYEIIKK